MVTIHPNRAGQAALLRSPELAKAVEDLAEALAEKIRAQNVLVEGEPGDLELPVEVVTFEEDDEARGKVTIAHPSGLSVQAKHGSLTRAASELGLEVHG